MKKWLLILSFLGFSAEAAKVQGVLIERGTKIPLADTNVFILPQKIKVITDARGRFFVENLPAGKFTWVVNSSGYKKLELEDEITVVEEQSPLAAERELLLEKNSYQVYETTIYGRGQGRDDTAKTLKASELTSMPGSGGDPLKAIQNLPGLARTSGFQNQLIIQGSAPQDSKYAIDGHQVPLIFHFGGVSSVLIPESLDRVEYLSAGYGPEYGRAIGGLVGGFTRNPKTDKVLQGFAYIDTYNAGAMVEGPIGTDKKSSLLLAARQSYIGKVLSKVAKGDGSLDLTVAPDFADASAIFQTQLSERDDFKVTSIVSRDRLEFVLREPVKSDPSIRGSFFNETSFFRIIPQYTRKQSETFTIRTSLGLGRDWVHVDIGDNFFILSTYVLTARGEVEKKISPHWTSFWGFDNEYVWGKVHLRLPSFYYAGGVINPLSTGTKKEVSVSKPVSQVGLYWKNILKIENTPWTIMPSLRADSFSETNEIVPLPRFAARYQVNDSLFFRGATGLYAQQPQPQEVNEPSGNPDLKSARAIHASVGLDKDFRGGFGEGFTLATGAFYKYLYRQITPSSKLIVRNGSIAAEGYNNSGTGNVIGAESLLRWDNKPWTGWLAYTLSRSTRTDSGFENYLFQYDQTHVITLIGAVDLPRNWKISSRFRYATGNPTTPIVGSAFDADNDAYVPVRGRYFSERLESFYQLDLRADKKWIYDKWILSLYLDIQNITNHRNIESVRYSYDYSTSTKITGLPIFPTFGLKGEF